ncbi:hypothetical protein RHGRI_027247 [Rhododendron griersonianum]|uniref:Uncharacterized protein n=1 Tax=Rhododendron griersonianum TaxID=479676 RepID=A0AAV6IXE7_9ERIC|nr:hypothetical protein RHGRI_027247 [Rhododendron griersonianum]
MLALTLSFLFFFGILDSECFELRLQPMENICKIRSMEHKRRTMQWSRHRHYRSLEHRQYRLQSRYPMRLQWDCLPHYPTWYNPSVKPESDDKVIMLDVFGGIPEELWSLTSLTHLNLARNYLTGPLSSSIAYLTQMQYLSVGINALSGEVPKELGKLTNLIVFNATCCQQVRVCPRIIILCPQLCHLHNIFYFDSSGVSGAIPSTFAALQNLQILWGSDNELTGSIPEFIGNWSKLRNL